MYLLLALSCTVLNEFIAQVLAWRSRTLAQGLEQLIDNPTLRSDFYNHGLIDGAKNAAGGKHPSYLSGDTFARAE
jgi:hypothetical protein